MAKKKEPYMVFQTKEEFDKFYDEVIKKELNESRVDAFKDGSTWVLSYVQELFQDMFKPEAFIEAEQEIRNRHIEQWRRTNCSESLKFSLDKKHDFKN